MNPVIRLTNSGIEKFVNAFGSFRNLREVDLEASDLDISEEYVLFSRGLANRFLETLDMLEVAFSMPEVRKASNLDFDDLVKIKRGFTKVREEINKSLTNKFD